MSRVKEIEQAIADLSPEEFRAISRWFREQEQQHWDRRLDEDASTGRLEFLFEESGTIPWPPEA